MVLFLLFIGVPLIEITLFIQVGGAIGLGWTLFIVVATAIIGAAMVRSQGAHAMQNLRESFSELRDPAEPLAHGAMILFSGALLLTPGFFTDTIGFALLVPGVRRKVFNWARKRVNVQSFQMGPGAADTEPRRPRDTVVDVEDAEFEDIPTTKRPTHKPSGWTKH